MIKAIIIDDEQHCIDRLATLIANNHKHQIHLEQSCRSVESGIDAIKKLQPDLIFLDVQIGASTGFELLQQLDEINFDIIFTTAFDKYAVQAFRFSAIDYLLKPVEENELTQAIEKVKERKSKADIANKMDTLFYNLKNINSSAKKIAVPTLNGLSFIDVPEIIRCESNINYTTIFLKDNRKLTVAKTLKEFEELLSNYNFFRVHNSHLVNLAYIKSYNKGKGGFVLMSDHSEIEVSTRRKDDFLKKLAEL